MNTHKNKQWQSRLFNSYNLYTDIEEYKTLCNSYSHLGSSYVTYGYLPSCRASLAFDRYQIIGLLLGDRITCVWTTCLRSLTWKRNGRKSNTRPMSRASDRINQNYSHDTTRPRNWARAWHNSDAGQRPRRAGMRVRLMTGQQRDGR